MNKDQYQAAMARLASGNALPGDAEAVAEMAKHPGNDGNPARKAQQDAAKAEEEARKRRQSAW